MSENVIKIVTSSGKTLFVAQEDLPLVIIVGEKAYTISSTVNGKLNMT